MFIGMSFTKLLFFMPIGNPKWPPSQDIGTFGPGELKKESLMMPKE
jgi:hypothetical protein